MSALESAGQLVLRYGSAAKTSGSAASTADSSMQPRVAFPENPNGSLADVAGICDETGRVCGLMPHPERYIDPTQHPRWTRGPLPPAGDGLRVFQNAVGYFQ
jgi:phosphoribosylformylglycinamidine synthase